MRSEEKVGRKPDNTYNGPLPDITWPQARGLWEGAKNHELRIQRCSDFGASSGGIRSHVPEVSINASGMGEG